MKLTTCTAAATLLAAMALKGTAQTELSPPVWLESSPYRAVVEFHYSGPIRDLTQSFDVTSPDGWWHLGLSVAQYQAERDGFLMGDAVSLVADLQHLGLPDGQPGDSPPGTILHRYNIVSALYGRGVAMTRTRLGETFTVIGSHGAGDEFDIVGFGAAGELDPFLLDAYDPRQPEWTFSLPVWTTARQPYLSSYTLTITATHYVPEATQVWGVAALLLLGIGTAFRPGRWKPSEPA